MISDDHRLRKPDNKDSGDSDSTEVLMSYDAKDPYSKSYDKDRGQSHRGHDRGHRGQGPERFYDQPMRKERPSSDNNYRERGGYL